MNIYTLEQMAKHAQQELARSTGRHDWKQIFRLG
jgi:hypothetical protein